MFHYLQDPDQFPEMVLSVWEASNFDYVYVSIGSKINEDTIRFNNPNLSEHEFFSNSFYQMMPRFVKIQPHIVRQLIVVFDDFSNVKLRDQNIQYLTGVSNTRKNSCFMMVNTKIRPSNLKKYIYPILNKLNEFELESSQFILANFVCFKNGTEREYEYSLTLPKSIQKVLCKSKVSNYDECLYQWYGYAYYTYNYVYNYKNYYLLQLMNANRIRSLFTNSLKNTMLSSSYEPFVTAYADNTNRRQWEQFMVNSINILD